MIKSAITELYKLNQSGIISDEFSTSLMNTLIEKNRIDPTEFDFVTLVLKGNGGTIKVK